MSKPPEKVLLVDDDQSLLDSFRRTHRKTLDLTTACGGAQGLEVLAADGPFDVVVSDYQMPEMNGAVFLSRVAESSPDSVRVMLTGNADQATAIDAVNLGRVFRFLNKPCEADVFLACMHEAFEQGRLRRAEHELLEKTLKGSIEVLSDVLSLCNPAAFGRASRVRSYVKQILSRIRFDHAWQVESAALLSQIGCVAIPGELIDREEGGPELSVQQKVILARHPRIGGKLLAKIPRLENVAAMISCQKLRYDEICRKKGEMEPVVARGGQILALCVAFDEHVSAGASQMEAVTALASDEGAFAPQLLKLLAHVQPIGQDYVRKELQLSELHVGMILDQNVFSEDGRKVVATGYEVNSSLLERLRNYAELRGIPEPIRMLVPISAEYLAA